MKYRYPLTIFLIICRNYLVVFLLDTHLSQLFALHNVMKYWNMGDVPYHERCTLPYMYTWIMRRNIGTRCYKFLLLLIMNLLFCLIFTPNKYSTHLLFQAIHKVRIQQLTRHSSSWRLKYPKIYDMNNYKKSNFSIL